MSHKQTFCYGTFSLLLLLSSCNGGGKYHREDHFTFGVYPQTVVKDEATIQALDALKSQNTLGYYEYQGNQYAKLEANPYDASYTFNDGTAIAKGKTYYFLVQSISWQVIKLAKNHIAYSITDKILDFSPYYSYDYDFEKPTAGARKINGKYTFPNNYNASTVRAYLNGLDGSSYAVNNYTGKGFIDLAFSAEERNSLVSSEVDNSGKSTGAKNSIYACENNQDQVFLISMKELDDYYDKEKEYRAETSDYYLAKGGYMDDGYGYYWTRSPYDAFGYDAKYIYSTGDPSFTFVHRNCGLRPAIHFDNSK